MEKEKNKMNAAAYKAEVTAELHSILSYWINYTIDPNLAGFVGRVDENDQPHPDAARGLVLNSRILWAFSAAWRVSGTPEYARSARLAYDCLYAHFIDRLYGGAFWSLDAGGRPPDTRKQIYGLAFLLYGHSQFYRASGEKPALDEAISGCGFIYRYSFDPRHGGYFEAFTRDWQPPGDQRLSIKDANVPKTMNTHLHVLEAYTNLYKAWPDPLLQDRIIHLLDLFQRHIIDKNTGHLAIFFDEQWTVRSTLISYGHDIEAAWLLHEAALTISDAEWTKKTGEITLRIAAAAAEGLDKDGGLWYEQENGQLVREKHWWPQAEAMVGFLQTWQLSGDPKWWERSMDSWDFIKKYIRHPAAKEWYWGVNADLTPMPGQDKAGFWKCPYHNSRACLEIMRRLDGH
jgi:mannobiose 2-epimerase